MYSPVCQLILIYVIHEDGLFGSKHFVDLQHT